MSIRRSLGLVVLCSGMATALNPHAPVLPDPARTPGDVLTTDPAVICQPGYTKTVRNVPQQVKEAVYREYGITTRENGEYEVDHLISLELGGSNSMRNLWPESYLTQPLNAHVKDDIENRLHELACAGKITFSEAQQAIAHNWEAAYVKYIGPLPGGVQVQKHPNQPSIPVTHVPTLPRGATPPAEQPTLNLPILPGYPGDSPTLATPATSTSSPAEIPPVPPIESDVNPNPDGSCPPERPVKVSKTGIYHLPAGDPNYRETHAAACFATPESAQAAGYHAPIK